MIIKVRHTIQMGHRLWKLGGKCENLHGHTWTIILSLEGVPDEDGILLDFHDVKEQWRGYLDRDYDHHFAFDREDPLLRATHYHRSYPGYVVTDFQPTVENLATYWAAVASLMFNLDATVELWEGENNCAVATSK